MTYKVCYWDKVAGEQRERDATPEEAAEIESRKAAAPAQQAEQSRVSAIDTAIAADSTVASLKAMTNAEFDAYWAANVTTLAQANSVLKRIARVVIRRVL